MTWTNEQRKRIMSAMRADLMSSEDEVSSGDETHFMVQTLPWRREELNNVIVEHDAKHSSTQSALCKRQQLKRVRNGESHKPIPIKMSESLNWALKISGV